MLKRIGLKALGVFLLFCGVGMIEMALTELEFELESRIFSGICGLILFAGGVLLAFNPLEKALDHSAINRIMMQSMHVIQMSAKHMVNMLH
ncbi:MAG: hypothetical protein ILP14_03835 [Oscillospiraceae bacterium]|nr:hypothetical protein [Oscillospiraceae bacterium]